MIPKAVLMNFRTLNCAVDPAAACIPRSCPIAGSSASSAMNRLSRMLSSCAKNATTWLAA